MQTHMHIYTMVHTYHFLSLHTFAHTFSRNLEALCRTAYLHLQKVAKERDNQYDTGVEISMERDYYKQLHETDNPNESLPRENGLPLGSPSPAKSPAVNPELMELKKRCRHLQEQLWVALSIGIGWSTTHHYIYRMYSMSRRLYVLFP